MTRPAGVREAPPKTDSPGSHVQRLAHRHVKRLNVLRLWRLAPTPPFRNARPFRGALDHSGRPLGSCGNMDSAAGRHAATAHTSSGILVAPDGNAATKTALSPVPFQALIVQRIDAVRRQLVVCGCALGERAQRPRSHRAAWQHAWCAREQLQAAATACKGGTESIVTIVTRRDVLAWKVCLIDWLAKRGGSS